MSCICVNTCTIDTVILAYIYIRSHDPDLTLNDLYSDLVMKLFLWLFAPLLMTKVRQCVRVQNGSA